MKKENKKKKIEDEQLVRDEQFKKQGNICLAVIVACFVVMIIVGKLNAGAAWLNTFFIVSIGVVAIAFIFSLRNVAKHLKQMQNDDR